MHKFKFGNGQYLKDKITGFTGMVIARYNYITGCDQYNLQPKVKDDGTPQDSKYFDEGRLESTGEVSFDDKTTNQEVVDQD